MMSIKFMVAKWWSVFFLCILLVSFTFTCLPLPVNADGGLVIPSALWENMEEEKQIAVINIRGMNTADVDLFISLLDNTGESNEITFFVPLSRHSGKFGLTEESFSDFTHEETWRFDMRIGRELNRTNGIATTLFAVNLMTNGVWLTPLWLPLILTGCADSIVPVATYETESSTVSIYDVEDNTDIDELILTTGLDQSVKDTLTRLRGQRIAVVTMRTQATETGDEVEGALIEERGLHLSWRVELDYDGSEYSYAYPLGTGAAWATPIKLTQVYIVTDNNIDFSVQYPEWGTDLSGYEGGSILSVGEPRIYNHTDLPAYAVDDIRDETGRIWKITYTQSNFADDIVVTTHPLSWYSSVYEFFNRAGVVITFFIALLMALLFHVLAWELLMPRLLGQRDKKTPLWKIYVGWLGMNMLFLPVFLIVSLLISMAAGGFNKELWISLFFLLYIGINILYLFIPYFDRIGTARKTALRSFVIVTLSANGAYLIFSVVYSLLTGVF
jgi:hypothetical protein